MITPTLFGPGMSSPSMINRIRRLGIRHRQGPKGRPKNIKAGGKKRR
jgi:hypothetical protein